MHKKNVRNWVIAVWTCYLYKFLEFKNFLGIPLCCVDVVYSEHVPSTARSRGSRTPYPCLDCGWSVLLRPINVCHSNCRNVEVHRFIFILLYALSRFSSVRNMNLYRVYSINFSLTVKIEGIPSTTSFDAARTLPSRHPSVSFALWVLLQHCLHMCFIVWKITLGKTRSNHPLRMMHLHRCLPTLVFAYRSSSGRPSYREWPFQHPCSWRSQFCNRISMMPLHALHTFRARWNDTTLR